MYIWGMQWEYKLVIVVPFDEDKDKIDNVLLVEAQFNALGLDGWELVSALTGEAIFKRKLS